MIRRLRAALRRLVGPAPETGALMLKIEQLSGQMGRMEARLSILQDTPEGGGRVAPSPDRESDAEYDSARALAMVYNQLMELRELILDVEARVARGGADGGS